MPMLRFMFGSFYLQGLTGASGKNGFPVLINAQYFSLSSTFTFLTYSLVLVPFQSFQFTYYQVKYKVVVPFISSASFPSIPVPSTGVCEDVHE